MKATTKSRKTKSTQKCSKSCEIPSTYAAIKTKYPDDLISPTFRLHLKWGEGHMIGLGTRTSYFRSSYKSIKCPYCNSTFSANKERVRHINWSHLGEENETTEEFNKGLRLININQLSDVTRKDLKSIGPSGAVQT